MSTELFTWLGIIFCLSQSAIFSGLNLAMFGLSRLRLETEAAAGNAAARKVLDMRRNSNFLLTTILWGNVAINVLLTLLSGSVLSGVGAFLFSTVGITFFGEIMPQAYFSRNALRMGALLAPVLRFYQILLYPVARPSAWLLDLWLGKEDIQFFKERSLRHMLRKHIEAKESDIDRFEGQGALNFLELDDTPVGEIGRPLDPDSILALPETDGALQFPPYQADPDDAFLQQISRSGKKWVVFTNPAGDPRLVLNSNAFLRAVLFGDVRSRHREPTLIDYCHRPILVRNRNTVLGAVIPSLQAGRVRDDSEAIVHDLILVWEREKRIITGTDILARLLKGIAVGAPVSEAV